jgi:hypothetical protein
MLVRPLNVQCLTSVACAQSTIPNAPRKHPYSSQACASSKEEPFEPSAAPSTATSATPARQVVQAYYDAWNRGDIDADDVVYHDAIFLEPFFGKAAVAVYFDKFRSIGSLADLRFVVTEITGDGDTCGVAWCDPWLDRQNDPCQRCRVCGTVKTPISLLTSTATLCATTCVAWIYNQSQTPLKHGCMI